jgi:hypothetical protein
MAKKQRSHRITVAFNYLVKSFPSDNPDLPPEEEGFTSDEFRRVVARLSDTTPLDDTDEAVIARIKAGQDLPFIYYQPLEEDIIFGDFEGAYYGQKFRNNILGEIDPHTLNLRQFHYLVAHCGTVKSWSV